ncbi:hypothetical protein BDV40DRAFT_276382 [Aspergillus tamarii]|uniref:Uncharacterized protein n=1 Tax=Aspergillus tamarii TaxID=41984 RepID=A0A5N6UI82_ASPTM|nr:hypothetical protein BDV40DRAFT_276382 [Aspergillus tamarii]
MMIVQLLYGHLQGETRTVTNRPISEIWFLVCVPNFFFSFFPGWRFSPWQVETSR